MRLILEVKTLLLELSYLHFYSMYIGVEANKVIYDNSGELLRRVKGVLISEYIDSLLLYIIDIRTEYSARVYS